MIGAALPVRSMGSLSLQASWSVEWVRNDWGQRRSALAPGGPRL